MVTTYQLTKTTASTFKRESGVLYEICITENGFSNISSELFQLDSQLMNLTNQMFSRRRTQQGRQNTAVWLLSFQNIKVALYIT